MRYLLILILSFSIQTFAEQTPPASPPPSTLGAPNMAPTRGVKVFDDAVFDIRKEDTKPRESTSNRSGTTRGLANDTKYNTKNREDAIGRCEAKKQISMKSFRDCVREDLNRQVNEVQESRDRIVDETEQPLRSEPMAPAPMDSSEMQDGD